MIKINENIMRTRMSFEKTERQSYLDSTLTLESEWSYKPKELNGFLARYVRFVSSASEGAVLK